MFDSFLFVKDFVGYNLVICLGACSSSQNWQSKGQNVQSVLYYIICLDICVCLNVCLCCVFFFFLKIFVCLNVCLCVWCDMGEHFYSCVHFEFCLIKLDDFERMLYMLIKCERLVFLTDDGKWMIRVPNRGCHRYNIVTMVSWHLTK